MKVFVYTGITLVIYALASADVSNLSFMQAALSAGSEYLNLILIGLGITQAGSVALLTKPKTPAQATAAEITLLVSSLVLLLNGQMLFVLANVVLMIVSKWVFAKPSHAEKQHAASEVKAA